jgi:peptide/nickel transport system ATP-binding protein
VSVAPPPLLEVRNLQKRFPVLRSFGHVRQWVRAIDGIDFTLEAGEILGLVGESGCGKSTLGKAIMGIHRPDAGSIRFKGMELVGLPSAQYLEVRGELQYVYQDAAAALDPRWKIKNSLDEAMVIHGRISREERDERVGVMLRAVGLRPEHLELFPHELSGGQQRRANLARILTLHPTLLILDEPTSGLDVSVQATILKLLRSLQTEFKLTYLLISHDLGVVRLMCHRVAVMYLGKIVEIGPTRALFGDPRHPYTRSLLAAIPQPGVRKITANLTLSGDLPDPTNLPSGCRFRTRCLLAEEICQREEPTLHEVGSARAAACHFA